MADKMANGKKTHHETLPLLW